MRKEFDYDALDSAAALTLDTPVQVSDVSEDGVLFSFTPSETDEYHFYSFDIGDCDPRVVLYGIFAEGYSVFFTANGGAFDETLQSSVGWKIVNVLKCSAIGAVSVWHPEKTFAGWNTKPDGSGETIDPVTYVPGRFMELYAIWTYESAGNVPVTDVSFEAASISLAAGETMSYPAAVSPANATNKKVTYTISDDSIAAVDANGKVTAKKAGQAIITATTADGGKRAAVEVWVLFKDVTVEGAYYYTSVYWAAYHDPVITAGYTDGSFGVGKDCQRRELLIFMWRYAGCPTKDISGKAYGDARTMLYRLAGKPSVSGTLKFPDCKSFKTNSDTYKAILWGSQKGITNSYNSGPYKGQFGVNLNCLREQIVTFLYRYDTKR